MAWIFGDGFDLYSAIGDATSGYWDSGLAASFTLVAGRFTGSQAANISANTASPALVKSSGANDAVHHLVLSFRQTSALSGTSLGFYFQFVDNITNQCCIVFRSDGVILLTSATPGGTVLATYTGAVSAQNTWFAFEFEVVIHNTAGSFTVRKNGNPSNDFTATSLNTRPGANSYANKLQWGMTNPVTQQLDDFLWRSDAASVPWVGDVRCYTRMPASDASVQFSRAPTIATVNSNPVSTTAAIVAGTARYTGVGAAPLTAPYDGAVSAATISLGTGYTGNMKCSLFVGSTVTAGGPGVLLGSATPIVNPVSGINTFTFSPPLSVTKGQVYCIGFDSDTSSGTWNVAAGTGNFSSTTAYASFPVSSPTFTSASAAVISSWTVTPTNYAVVAEAQQDGTTSYVYDSTIGHADFYNIAPLSVTPASVIAVVTRGFMEKSDAGFRSGAVQLKSGGSTVAASTLNLATSWLWSWRVDLTDPNTAAAWTPVAVNAVQIGPTVIG